MATLLSCLEALAPLGAALGLGWALRRTRVCSPADGEVGGLRARCCDHLGCFRPLQTPTRRCPHAPRLQTAAKFVAWVTLPSLILQTFNG